MNIFSLSGLFTAFSASILLIILLVYGKTKLHRVWTLFNIAVLVWGIGCFWAGKAASPSLALTGWRIAISGGLFIGAFFYHTVYTFTNIKKKRSLTIIYIQATLYFLLTLLTETTLSGWHIVFNSIYYPAGTVPYIIMISSWVAVVYLGNRELAIFLKSSKGIQQIKARYLFVAFLIGFIGGGPTLLPALNIGIYPYGNFGVALYGIIGTYAILRIQLLDIRVAVTRVGVFVLVYTLVLGVPLGLTGWGRYWLRGIFGANWYWAPVTFAIVLATIGPFIYIFLERKAEEKLLREQRRYQDTLKQASIGMTRIRNLRRLLDLIAHIVTKAVRISYTGIYLYNRETNEYLLAVSRDKGRVPIPKLLADNPLVQYLASRPTPLVYEEVKRLSEDNITSTYKVLEENMRLLTATVVIPSALEDRLLALFVLGEKTSGQIYTPEDLNVFQVLASQAALAIENARFFEEAKQMQEQIGHAEKMATIGTMANGLSHQINNRFYALSLIAADTIDTIKCTDTANCAPEIKDMLGHINHALERIEDNVLQGGEVVKGILKYTRKQEEGFEDVTMDEILDSAFDMLQYKVRLRDIDIIRNYPKDTARIHGNRVQLQEVFFNFGDNAYDAITERRDMLKEPGYRGRVTFSAQPKGNILEITVEDNGMGIQDDCTKKIFTPFFTTKASSHKGTGLGLYVIKKIITDNHKGKISFESAYKVGTRFIVELPAAKG